MATLPQIRKKVSLSSDSNRSLKDILAPMGAGVEVLSVEPFSSPLHNTKAIVKIDNSKVMLSEGGYQPTEPFTTRAIHYNRIDLATILPEKIIAPLSNLPAVIKELNSKHRCDFTEDDLEVGSCGLQAKPTSLGYYSGSTPVVATVPLDVVEFAVKTLMRGDEFAGSIGAYSLFYKIGDETFFGDFQSYGQYIKLNPLDLATKIKNEIESSTTDVSVEIILSEWYEERYRGYEPLGGYIIAITNNLNKPVDVAVVLTIALEPNAEYHDNTVALLPNARLQPKGTKGAAGSCACGCTGSANGNDLAFVYNQLPDVVDEPFTLNGATLGEGWSNSWLDDHDLFVGMSPYEANSGLNTVVRVYHDDVNSDAPPPDGNPRFMFKNMSDYPITINSPRFKEPVVLGPIEYNQPLDRVFINAKEWVEYVRGAGVNGAVSINDIYYTFQLDDEVLDFGGDFGAFIKFTLNAAGVNAKDIKFAFMKESSHGYVQAYFENTGDVPLKIGFWISTSESYESIIPPFILEPAGTVGLPYDLDEDVAFSDMLDGVSEWLYRDKSITNFHWRGVTNNHNNDVGQLAHIFSVGWYYDRQTDSERQYYENVSPYVEEVILDYGLATELKIRLRPSRIVTATAEPQ